VIGLIFGKHVSDNLLPLSLNLQEFGMRIDGYVTNSLYSGAKTEWILFVNNRLISDAPEFKKAVKVIFFFFVVFVDLNWIVLFLFFSFFYFVHLKGSV
jgi:DNA mismatch repair ATPase MutL